MRYVSLCISINARLVINLIVINFKQLTKTLTMETEEQIGGISVILPVRRNICSFASWASPI
jgi:hypothetical protein